jgi:hypothetical protein
MWFEISKLFPLIGIDEILARVRMHGSNVGLDPIHHAMSLISIMNSSAVKHDPFGPEFRRHVLSLLYVQYQHELYPRVRADLPGPRMWTPDSSQLSSAIAERGEIIADLHSTLEALERSFAEYRSSSEARISRLETALEAQPRQPEGTLAEIERQARRIDELQTALISVREGFELGASWLAAADGSAQTAPSRRNGQDPGD